MSETQTNELTPEARAIIRRARTSFLFSIGLLIIGFLAIGGVLTERRHLEQLWQLLDGLVPPAA